MSWKFLHGKGGQDYTYIAYFGKKEQSYRGRDYGLSLSGKVVEKKAWSNFSFKNYPCKYCA